MKKSIFALALICSSFVFAGVEQEVYILFRGDVDGSGSINITDAIFLDNYLFSGGPSPVCMDASDANYDGSVNVSDVAFILDYLFDGGSEPSPFETSCMITQ